MASARDIAGRVNRASREIRIILGQPRARQAVTDLHDALDQLGPKDVLRLKVLRADYTGVLSELQRLRDLLNRLVLDEALEKGWRE
jgi:hypothetical protein